MNHEDLIRIAVENGADKAAVISQAKIVLSREFWDICAGNGCGNFNKCWMCPPCTGKIEDLMEQVRGYTHGVLYQTIWEIEDSYDIEGMSEASRNHSKVSQRIQEAMLPVLGKDILHLSCGGCNLCTRCAKVDDEPCRFPDKALPSLEGYGVDVYKTSKGTGLKYINGAETVTYFGMVLFTEA